MQDNIQDIDVQTLTNVLGGNGRDTDPWGTGDQPQSPQWRSVGLQRPDGYRHRTDPWTGELRTRGGGNRR